MSLPFALLLCVTVSGREGVMARDNEKFLGRPEPFAKSAEAPPNTEFPGNDNQGGVQSHHATVRAHHVDCEGCGTPRSCLDIGNNVRKCVNADEASKLAKSAFEDDVAKTGWESVKDKYIREISGMGNWDAVKKHYENDKFSLLIRVHFREKYVLEVLSNIRGTGTSKLYFTWPDHIPGSRTPTSDFDVTIAVDPTVRTNQTLIDHFGDDVKGAELFYLEIQKHLGAPPGIAFDTNIYVDTPQLGTRYDAFRAPAFDVFLRAVQDVAALTKMCKYMTSTEWNAFKKGMADVAGGTEDREMKKRYALSLKNLEDAESMHLVYANELLAKFKELAGKHQKWTHLAGDLGTDDKTNESLLSKVSRISKKFPELDSDATYSLYLSSMGTARELEIELKKRKRPLFIDPLNEEVEGVLKTYIRRQVAKALYFAPEAYSTDGAYMHIVLIEQLQSSRAWIRIKPYHLLCSLNEQAGDYFKEVNFHLAGNEEAALYQGAKYLTRFYHAIELLHKKISQMNVTSAWVGVPEAESIMAAVKPLLGIRKDAFKTSDEKWHLAKNVTGASEFQRLLGATIVEITQKVREHAATVNAKYRLQFDLHASEWLVREFERLDPSKHNEDNPLSNPAPLEQSGYPRRQKRRCVGC
eukprot:GEMP01026339.1.p1 GENE.GEMP01026339.1~~GEMP01026339.1.p1  ORF type:complete len:639 (+),score=128.32 GEMP01026339.1:400-2316(+)